MYVDKLKDIAMDAVIEALKLSKALDTDQYWKGAHLWAQLFGVISKNNLS